MKPDTRRFSSGRLNREDGDITKARIIEMAGRLFAERGFADVTSKEVCEQAKVSITSVNYHFGSREGLYIAVLAAMLDFFSAPEQLAKLQSSTLPPEEKLRLMIRRMVELLFDSGSWQVRLWARELVSPTNLVMRTVHARRVSGLSVMMRVLSLITGIPEDTPELQFCFVGVLSPLVVMLLQGKDSESPHQRVFEMSQDAMLEYLFTFVNAGLVALCRPPGAANAEREEPGT